MASRKEEREGEDSEEKRLNESMKEVQRKMNALHLEARREAEAGNINMLTAEYEVKKREQMWNR